MTSRRKQYTAAFKLQVIKAAEETNNCAAAREFSINEKLVMSNPSPWKVMMTWTDMMTFKLTTKCLDLHCTVHTIVFSYSILDFICTIEYY